MAPEKGIFTGHSQFGLVNIEKHDCTTNTPFDADFRGESHEKTHIFVTWVICAIINKKMCRTVEKSAFEINLLEKSKAIC